VDSIDAQASILITVCAMKKYLHIYLPFLLLSILIFSPMQAQKKTDFTKSVGYKYLENSFSVYDGLQKQIFGYAEPGYQEYKSSKALAEHLQAHGFTVEWGVAGIPTAFIATYGSGEPVVGLIGEYDALPGMSQDTSTFRHPLEQGAAGHACGHNLIGTGPAAAAVAISKWLAEGHKGTVKYFGCPAEEGGGGKAYMTRAGCFDVLDAFLDWHPDVSTKVTMASGLANVRVRFSFQGTSAHASVAPWDGRSALDAVEIFDHMMNMMREHVPDFTRIHYIIDDGGQAPNVVPATASALYYIRAPKAATVLEVLSRAIDAAKGAALGTRTTMSYEIMNGNYESLKNDVLSGIMLGSLKKVGGVNLDEREKEFCAEIMENSGADVDLSNFESFDNDLCRDFDGGSSDVGNVSQMCPLASLNVASCVKNSGLHTWQLASIAGSTVGTKILLNVAKVFYLTALELYTNPAAVKAAKDEYYSVQGHDFQFVPLMGDRQPPFDYCK
jgi:amidohydrolase